MRNLPQADQPQTISLRTSGLGWPRKDTIVRTSDVPKLANNALPASPVSTNNPLAFQLDQADATFNYRLTAGDVTANCNASGSRLTCDLATLRLAHATTYQFTLSRYFQDKPAGTVFQAKLATVEPVIVTGSNIANNQTVYDKPAEISLALNRSAKSADAVSLSAGGNAETIAQTFQVVGDRLIIRPTKPLPRNTTIKLTVNKLNAADGGYLPAPYVLEFRTSGGPKVTATNIGSFRVASNTTVRLSFDSQLAASQDLGSFIQIVANGKPVPATLSSSGTTVQFTMRQSLGACTSFIVNVSENLQNLHGVSGGNAWRFQSRTTCQQPFTIGTSVQGRAITGYRFGSGSVRIVYVGGTHGNERSSSLILQRWVDYLEANPAVVPAGRAITIIPTLNPDAYAANKRTNANNVDLNRNFPSNNWKQSVTMPDKSTNTNGGGNTPLSEPESRALATYIQSHKPRLTLTYHATGNVAVPNQTGDSDALAWKYARNSSVSYLSPIGTATFFEYDTTGAFEDWLHDKVGIPALLIELNTMSGNEFDAHLPALRIMAGS